MGFESATKSFSPVQYNADRILIQISESGFGLLPITISDLRIATRNCRTTALR